MRVSRVYVEHELATGDELTLSDRAARYVSQVLRLREGGPVILFNGDGRNYNARVTRCGKQQCRVVIGGLASVEAPGVLRLQLGIGISRGERMDYAIQKSVELGVSRISPLLTERCVVRLKPERMDQRIAHWQGISISACEQSGRSRLPQIDAPAGLAEWLTRHPGGFVLQHRADRTLPSMPSPGDTLHLLVGPEGGLADVEIAQAESAGYAAVRLGPRVMRTETAPLAALAAIQTLWGDFRH